MTFFLIRNAVDALLFLLFQVSAENFAVSRMSEDLGGPPAEKISPQHQKKSFQERLKNPFESFKNHRVADIGRIFHVVAGWSTS